jgi:predicted glycoside hydrolase/deacetylase ChbG (UPF0249 family)
MNTAQRLGYGDRDRLLIVNADDFGLCRDTNEGIADLMADGAVCSASVMMTCAWSADAAARCNRIMEPDVGIHWTLTSEWTSYKWGPIGRRKGTETLTGPDGWFPASIIETERYADPDEVRAELIAQTEAALQAGIALTHADNHMGSLYGFTTGKDFLPTVFDICVRYGLPFRLPRRLLAAGGRSVTPELQERAKARARQAEDRGIVLPDYVTGLNYTMETGETYAHVKAEAIAMLRGLKTGVTEWIAHPSRTGEELRGFCEPWQKRGMELRLWQDPDVRETLEEEGIQLIGWRELQKLQESLS